MAEMSLLYDAASKNQTREAIMVVAILIATMAFQAGLSPPCGIWQEDLNQHSLDNDYPPHKARESIMAYKKSGLYRGFMRSNTVAYVSSLSIILLLISGLPLRSKFFMWFLMVIMWLSVTSIAVTYGIAIIVITPSKDAVALIYVVGIEIIVWGFVMGVFLVGNLFRLADKWLRRKGVIAFWRRGFRDLGRAERGREANRDSS